jgi:hypothetical protein
MLFESVVEGSCTVRTYLNSFRRVVESKLFVVLEPEQVFCVVHPGSSEPLWDLVHRGGLVQYGEIGLRGTLYAKVAPQKVPELGRVRHGPGRTQTKVCHRSRLQQRQHKNIKMITICAMRRNLSVVDRRSPSRWPS